MQNIKQEQLYALDRLGHFLAKLEFSTDPLEIEAFTYSIFRTAEASYIRMNILNKGGTPPPSEFADMSEKARKGLNDGK